MSEHESDTSLQLNSLDCWDYTIELECLQGSQDLQLAAELGKTLLERNKELEGSLRQKQTIIDDQKQEIEYLTKQTAALREVSDSRLRIYEQLEVSIQDLERQNHRLVLENSAGKKHIKSLSATIESLELKCEELQTTIDELRLQVDVFKRKSQKSQEQSAQSFASTPIALRHVNRNEINILSSPEFERTHTKDEVDCHILSPVPKKTDPPSSQQNEAKTQDDKDDNDAMEQISQLLGQLREGKTQYSRDQRRIAELEEQLSTVIQQNQALENQVINLHHQHDDEKSMYDELNTLEEVRKGQMCSRCLRNVDKNNSEIPEDDDSSMLEELMGPPQFRSSFHMDVQESKLSSSSNKKETGHLYKDLVEKYEALLEVHRQPSRNQKRNLSLQEELQMSGDFNQAASSIKDTDEESGHGDSLKPEKHHNKARPPFPHTPTDFSEAETSSSGFSDETSNKSTQTEDRPGSFLCTIADGDDCKFSIYDDTSPIASRFKNRPEYQQLFKEIFMVLKNTTDNDETQPETETGAPAPEETIFPTNEENNQQSCEVLAYDDDSQSVVSSTMSELSLTQNEPTTIIENIIQSQNQPIPEADVPPSTKEERVLRPLVRQPLEYLSVEVRKRSSSRRKNKYADRSDSPVTHIIGSPKINYASRPSSGRRKGRDNKQGNVPEAESLWNGNTLQFWSTNRNIASPTPSQGSGKAVFEFKPSSASQDLHKLKKLDLSYAQVLRNADTKKLVRQGRK